ncbi:hypothetical protein E5288_WYG020764 [Bos mutus]|uniref:Golgi SNAP receptor complex member 1 n=4 Tax=Artiodactyla TaxID=91561 RepID=A0A6B0R6N5_9CETA|nr:hypothetical protein [Bos mutus]
MDLRKQARQLENELDLKLVSFSKLCTSYSHSSARDGRRDSSDTTPLLNGSSQDRMFETMAIEIEQLLARLTGVNDKMAEYTNSAGVPSLNAALMHTLQRHRDILQDYTHEFHKTKANFVAIRERENLMGSVRKDIESYKSGSGVNNRRTELFLKEHDHLRNSDRLIEETISIAMATKENMTSQRGMLKSIQISKKKDVLSPQEKVTHGERCQVWLSQPVCGKGFAPYRFQQVCEVVLKMPLKRSHAMLKQKAAEKCDHHIPGSAEKYTNENWWSLNVSSGLSSSSLANLEMESGPREFLIGAPDYSPVVCAAMIQDHGERHTCSFLDMRDL